MASGTPDWYGFRMVNIFAQDLSEIINRPTYGAAQRSAGGTSATPTGLTTLVTVSGQGMIYGGYLYVDGTGTCDTDIWQITVDGTVMSASSLFQVNKRKITDKHMDILYEVNYDDTSFLYTHGIMPAITFETSFDIKYSETNGRTPVVVATVIYALI